MLPRGTTSSRTARFETTWGSRPTAAARRLATASGCWSSWVATRGSGRSSARSISARILVQSKTPLILRWYDYLLKGIDNGMGSEKPVKLFVMGKNAWREEDGWPLARAQKTRYYLHSQGKANTLSGDGALSTAVPADEPADKYTGDQRGAVPLLAPLRIAGAGSSIRFCSSCRRTLPGRAACWALSLPSPWREQHSPNMPGFMPCLEHSSSALRLASQAICGSARRSTSPDRH